MLVVLAIRKPVINPEMVRTGLDVDRAVPGCHRSIFLAMWRG